MSADCPLLIRNAEIATGKVSDVLVEGGKIAALGQGLVHQAARVIDAGGACLLPGLHDHHIHVAASVVALQSVTCGPPEVADEAGLAAALRAPGEGWLRGVGYHESVCGLPDRHRLDDLASHRPIRIQHRSGRMWLFNSAGLDLLLHSGVPLPPGLEQIGGQWTGRLFDEDRWLRDALAGSPPAFDRLGDALARMGVTGLTEMSPANALPEAAHFAREIARSALPQRVVLAGSLALGELEGGAQLARGPFKLHLHEARFPDWDQTLEAMRAARVQGRGTAVHCVTEAELVFALGLFAELGPFPLDRIEHGSVIPDALLDQVVRLALPVVVQPAFVLGRGDQYLADIPTEDMPWLYRLASLRDAGVVLAGGSDAPYGSIDPWSAMRSAVERRTASGAAFGPAEALTPESALALYLVDPVDLGRTRRIELGAVADLCLLHHPWQHARNDLSAALVRATICNGNVAFLNDT
ncbi:MAG: amidohydrolase family protein, partial [Novosphingobium sp.]|nr:amidohydrolase family protein [Novosphingobium sp.]